MSGVDPDRHRPVVHQLDLHIGSELPGGDFAPERTAFTGGVGTIFGTFLGMLVLQGFKTGLNMVGVQTFWQQVAQGGLLVVALAFDFYRKHTRDKRALEESMAARGAQLPNKKARA